MTFSGRTLSYLLSGSLFFPLVIVSAWFLDLISVTIFMSWIIGWTIVFAGFVIELLFIRRGLSASDKLFIRNVLGAISIRLFLTVILISICLLFLELSRNNFIFSIFIFYIFYLIIEIFYLNVRRY